MATVNEDMPRNVKIIKTVSNPVVLRKPTRLNDTPGASTANVNKSTHPTSGPSSSTAFNATEPLRTPNRSMHEGDPQGLVIPLMLHQKQALSWALQRENEDPGGGILADDMGLGKTLTMIALILKQKSLTENNESQSPQPNEIRRVYNGGTLVVCPAGLIYQWAGEIEKRVERDLLMVRIHHGSSRETNTKKLANFDIVLTSYSLVIKDDILFDIKWERVILDEAHYIKNYKSKTSVAVCNLLAKFRWTLTGTPVHNKHSDLYSLLKFLRCEPLNDLAVWRRVVVNKKTEEQQQLNRIMASLILRRTKQILQEQQTLDVLPQKTCRLIQVTLERTEMDVYQKVLLYSRTMFVQFLKQQTQKQNLNMRHTRDHSKYLKLYKLIARSQRVKKIKHSDIFVLLLKMRQICSHPALISSMLSNSDNESDAEDDHTELNLLEKLNALSIDENDNDDDSNLLIDNEIVTLRETLQRLFRPTDPVFSDNWISSKITTALDLIRTILPTGEKIIVVSQWTKFLKLISNKLKSERINYFQLDKTVSIEKRVDIVESLNCSTDKVQILLLSLTAGGVGLNLIGANHLILLDIHWNPQLEIQAQDRIYRVGQRKPVNIYRFICIDTIEEPIRSMQERKLTLAADLLSPRTRGQRNNRLSIADVRRLLNV